MNKTYFRYLGNSYDTLEDLIIDNTTYNDVKEYLCDFATPLELPFDLGEMSLMRLIEEKFGTQILYNRYVSNITAELISEKFPVSFKDGTIEKVEEKVYYKAVCGTQTHKNEILEDLLYDLIDDDELEYLFNCEYPKVYIGDASFYPYDVAKWSDYHDGTDLLDEFKLNYCKGEVRDIECDLIDDSTTEFCGYTISIVKENVGTA